MKWFPPFFPDSHKLDRKPWHRWVWLLSGLFSLCATYSCLLSVLTALALQFSPPGLLGWLMIPPSLPLLWASSSQPTSFNLVSSPVVNWLPISHQSIVSVLSSSTNGLWLLAAYYFILIFLPSGLYRLFLSQLSNLL